MEFWLLCEGVGWLIGGSVAVMWMCACAVPLLRCGVLLLMTPPHNINITNHH